jgi:hypothetical protein
VRSYLDAHEQKKRPWAPDVATKTAAKGARLADELERNVFQGEATDALKPFVGRFGVVVLLLRALNEALNLTGKPGKTGKFLGPCYWSRASELVNHRLGGYYDEGLAELLQGVNDRSRNLDGGSISRNRNRLKREYPFIYAHARSVGRGEDLAELEMSVLEVAIGKALRWTRSHR